MARQYDIVLFGATGYTGQYCAKHIAKHLPTDVKWAVAGRSQSKLAAVAKTVQALNSDRVQPNIEIVELNSRDLDAITKRTKVLLNCVGPYHLYSTPVVEACARNGTHYIDVTGESPWVKEMVEKYHEVAKANGAIVIPQNGNESAPADLTAYALVTRLRKDLSVPTKEVVFTVHEQNIRPSGGTLATLLSIFERYSLLDFAKSVVPTSICPVTPPKLSSSSSILTKITGVRQFPDLGTLTTSLQGATDLALVYRSWGLLSPTYNASKEATEDFYGANFQFSSLQTVRNFFTGLLGHFALAIGPILLALPPLRWLLKRVVYEPGQGPSPEEAAREYLEFRAIAVPDDPQVKQRAYGKLRWEGSVYELTGIFMAEAGMTILKNEEALVKKLKGGIMTPATLGDAYIERLANVGVKIETKMLNY